MIVGSDAKNAHPVRTASEPLVSAYGLRVEQEGRRILDGVGLEVRAGETVSLIGPNGAGKSTLVRVLLGLVEPSGGIVRRRPRLRIGYMPQKLAVDPVLPLTARRFLSLAPKRPGQDPRRVLAEVGAERILDQPVQGLSGGEFQRMLLARALLNDPDLLVLDEPLQGVDFNGQIALFQLIRNVREMHGCGVLIVSHDLHLVMSGTDRVICLNQHVCCSGQPEAVSRHPEYLRLFGPRGAEAFSVYSHEHDHRHTITGEILPAPAVIDPETPNEASGA